MEFTFIWAMSMTSGSSHFIWAVSMTSGSSHLSKFLSQNVSCTDCLGAVLFWYLPGSTSSHVQGVGILEYAEYGKIWKCFSFFNATTFPCLFYFSCPAFLDISGYYMHRTIRITLFILINPYSPGVPKFPIKNRQQKLVENVILFFYVFAFFKGFVSIINDIEKGVHDDNFNS